MFQVHVYLMSPRIFLDSRFHYVVLGHYVTRMYYTGAEIINTRIFWVG